MRSKKGCVVFDIKLFENYITEYGDDNVVFRNFIPSHIETNIVSQKMKFWGYSNKFRTLDEGEQIPEYECQISVLEGGIKRVDFVEKSA